MPVETISSIGLDIGRNSIKAIQLQKRQDGKIALLAYGKKNLPTNKSLDSILHPLHYISTLSALLQSPNYGKFSGRDFAVALPSRHTYIQQNTTTDKFIQQANQTLGSTIEELLVNTYQINPSTNLSIATNQTVIQPHLDTLATIGNVVQTDHELSAAIRSIGIPSRPTLFVDIGGNESTTGIYNGLLSSTYEINFGVYLLAYALSENLRLSVSQSIELLFSYGFLPSSLQAKIKQTTKNAMASFINELQRQIQNYNLQQVILLGGGAAIPGIEKYLEIVLQISVHIANPWKRIGKYPLKPIPRKITPMFATAIGLAFLDLA